MRKSINIGIGIALSVLLFYLFIKDVNTLKLTHPSGLGSQAISTSDRAVFVADVTGFRTGDRIMVSDKTHPEGEMRTIERITRDESRNTHVIIVTDPCTCSVDPARAAVLKFPRLQRALASAHYIWLLPSLIFTLAALWIRSYRWKFFFPDHRGLSINSLWIAVCIGYMANNVLPFRMGEIVRAWIFSRKEKRGISESFGTIVMERVFDILSILILFVAFIFYFSARGDVILPGTLIQGAWILAVIALGALACLIAMHIRPTQSLLIIRFLLKPLPARFGRACLRLFESFIQGLAIFSSFHSLLSAFVLSMVIWLDLGFAYYCLFLAVDIKATLLVAIFLIVGLAFAVSIPSAPGFIGTFHFVGKEVLKIMGIQGNLEAYVLLAHAMAYIPVLVLGFVYLSLENLSLKDLRQSIHPIRHNPEER